MAILLNCGECGRQFRVKDQFRGTRLKCPGCKAQVLVDGPHVQGYDVFVSYSSKDVQVADAVCAALETKGVRCWMAPRDIPAGASWGAAIIEGIEDSRLFLLLFSEHSNQSDQVLREVERAVAKRIPLVPLRLDRTPMGKSLEYFLASCHWQDATDGPLEDHLAGLTSVIRARLLQRASTEVPATARAAPAAPAGQRRRYAMPALVAVIVVGLVAIAAGVALSLRGRPDEAGPSTAAAPATNPVDNWTPLFNGRNLDGWSLSGSKVTSLIIADGVLSATNSGKPGYVDHLVTDRRDFQNLRLRYEVMLSGKEPQSSVQIRVDPSDAIFGGMRGYAVWIRAGEPAGVVRFNVASRIRPNLRLAEAEAPPDAVQPDRWVPVHVTLDGTRVAIEVDGKPVILTNDPGNTFRRGAVALGISDGVLVKYRNIEVQPLPPSPPSAERRLRWASKPVRPKSHNEQWHVFAYAGERRWIETLTDSRGFIRCEWQETARTDEYVQLRSEWENGKFSARIYNERAEFGTSPNKLKVGHTGTWESD